MLLLAAMAPWSSFYAHSEHLKKKKMCCHQKCCCNWRSSIPATSRQQSRYISDLHVPSVAAWDHSTPQCLSSSCMHMVNVHWDAFPIRNLLLPHQFYAHKWMSTEMVFQLEVTCCHLISFMHRSKCPLRWRSNQKSSVAISSVLCTQVNVHRDDVAIKHHVTATSHKQSFFCIQCPQKCRHHQISPTSAMFQSINNPFFIHNEH